MFQSNAGSYEDNAVKCGVGQAELPRATVEPGPQVHLLPGEEVPGAEVLPVLHGSQGDGGGEGGRASSPSSA